ncbi:MAG: hypothetical protein QOE77_4049 [Blastocatellia bacterium]|nr:hypothetical protein [Blastocatellia bacterium]
MSDQDPAKPTSPAQPKPEREPWYKRLSVVLSLAALIVAVPTALFNAFFAVRGPEIVVLEPKTVVLHKNSGPRGGAVLSVAVPFFTINTSTSHGDVLIGADIRFEENGPRFNFDRTATPIFLNSQGPAGPCDMRNRCFHLGDLLIIEEPEAVVDMPPGTARTRYLSFNLSPASGDCTGASADCLAYGDFEHAVRRLASRPFELRATVRFHADGEREIRCFTGPRSLQILLRDGSQAVTCSQRQVSGDPFL